jgi:predicted transglutaminase-like cysteine proteinase
MKLKLTIPVFFALTTALMLGACSSPEVNEDLAQLQAKKDSLLGVSAEINAEIKELENQLLELTGSEDMVMVSALDLKMLWFSLKRKGSLSKFTLPKVKA